MPQLWLLLVLAIIPQTIFSVEDPVFSTPMGDVPTMASSFLIKTKPSRTAVYLPLLQKQFGIPVGALPNPIGISLIYNYTEETYRITKFHGKGGSATGKDIANLLKPSKKSARRKGFKPGGGGLGMTVNLDDINLNNPGTTRVKTHAVGVKMDVMLLPFLQLFGLVAYLNSSQVTALHGVNATGHIVLGGGNKPHKFPIGKPHKPNKGIKIPIGNITIPTKLEGFVGLGGMNLLFGYKGFFFSFMLSGGYVRLDDTINHIYKFTEKPILYYAPRIGYNYRGIFTVYFGIQGVELFGSTKGKDLSKATSGLVKSYTVSLEKFPVNFLAGFTFMLTREFVISMEYVGSPDGYGVNIETGFRI